MSLVVVFADGLGVGPPDPDTNPLARFGLPRLAAVAGVAGMTSDCVLRRGSEGAPTDRSAPRSPAHTLPPDRALYALDATLGVPGLPQSATGQCALLTGVNAAQLLGRHHGPYPGAELRDLLAQGTWWDRHQATGRTVAFANAFPDAYLRRAGSAAGRMGAFARSAQLAGVRLRGPGDLVSGNAVSAFISNEGWRDVLGYQDIPARTFEQAGQTLAALATRYDLVVFEHYATDIAGHAQDWEAAEKWLAALDQMCAAARTSLDPTSTLALVSDHGNLEDMTHGRHTTNPALTLWMGPEAPAGPFLDLTDVARAVDGVDARTAQSS